MRIEGNPSILATGHWTYGKTAYINGFLHEKDCEIWQGAGLPQTIVPCLPSYLKTGGEQHGHKQRNDREALYGADDDGNQRDEPKASFL